MEKLFLRLIRSGRRKLKSKETEGIVFFSAGDLRFARSCWILERGINMGRVLLCAGKLAEKPYYIEKTGDHVYSAEELCFVLRKNAYLLEESILEKKLAEWLSDECGLPETAKKLQGMLRSGCSVSAFVTALLTEIGYCTGEEIAAVDQLLQNNAGLSGSEKKKVHADYLVQNGRYAAALSEYDDLLAALSEGEPLRAKIWHNIGIAYAGLHRFKQAAGAFLQAYTLSEDESEQKDYLAALRLHMGEAEYVRFIAQKPEYTEKSLELEKKLAQIKSRWQASASGEQWLYMTELKKTGKTNEYYAQMEKTVAGLKEEYRRNMA